MIIKPKSRRNSKKNVYMIYGVLSGLFLSLVVMIGEMLFHDMPLTFVSFINHQRHNPTYWFLDSIPILLGVLGSWLGDREDKITSSSRATLREKEFFETLVNNSPIAITILDADHKIIAINSAFEDLFEYSKIDAVGNFLDDLLTDESIHAEAVDFTNRALAGESFRATSKRKKKDDRLIDVEIHGVPVFIGDEQIGALGLYIDISEKVKSEDQLKELLEKSEKLAKIDVLTGLLNRRAITEQAEAELIRSNREKSPLCLMLIDVDRLKDINDAYGHQAGDKAIMHVARSLEKGKRGYDAVGRWGGDEMMLVLPNTNLKNAEIVANRLCRIVMDFSTEMDEEFNDQLSISVGLACVTEEIRSTGDIDDLIARSDNALYDAKIKGGGQVCKNPTSE